jgi:hypothetical protein
MKYATCWRATTLSHSLTACDLILPSLLLQGKAKMSEDEMEQLMDALEKMHHTELQKHPERWANLIGSPLPAK